MQHSDFKDRNKGFAQTLTKPAPVIDQYPLSKSFPLAAILSLSTGLMLAEDMQSLHDLVGYIVEKEPSAATTAVGARDAKECLEAQLPFLTSLDISLLYAAYKSHPDNLEEELQAWVEIQTSRYGNSFDVMPLSRWIKSQKSHKL